MDVHQFTMMQHTVMLAMAFAAPTLLSPVSFHAQSLPAKDTNMLTPTTVDFAIQ